MGEERHVRLFRNGRNRAVRIPREFHVFGDVLTIRRDGDQLILTPPRRRETLIELLDRLETIDEEWPELDDPPPDPIRF